MTRAETLRLIERLRKLAAFRSGNIPDSKSDYQRGYRCGGSHAFAQAADMIEAELPAEGPGINGTLLSCEFCGSKGGGCNVCEPAVVVVADGF